MKVLEVKELNKSFGGNKAVRDCTFDVEEKRITCLIGPNGAGKTTIFNLITGVLKADSGSVLYKGRDICGESPIETVNQGIVRTFQDMRLWNEFTVLQNIQMAIRPRYGEGILKGLFSYDKHPKRVEEREKAMEALEVVGLADKADSIVTSLSYGEQKLICLARAYAAKGEMLLLDEPASGLDKSGFVGMQNVLDSFMHMGKTILLVEHNMDFVKDIADEVVFLHQGHALAQGKIDDITADKELTNIYFGY